jgi:hypothetical protein
MNTVNKCDNNKIEKCKKINKICNVKTGRCNKISSLKTNKKLSNKCDNNKIEKCKKINKICNVKTGRCNKIPSLKTNKKSLKKTNKKKKETYKKNTTTNEKIEKLKKIWKKVKLNNTKEKKEKAAKIIANHLLPFITKTFSLRNRVKYANEILRYGFIKKVKNNNLYDSDINPNNFKVNTLNNYYLDDDVHLFKKIGTDSVYGSIYNTKYKINNKFYNICGKIMCNTSGNKQETKILTKVSSLTLNKKTPHFPILYFNGYITKDYRLTLLNDKLPKSVRHCKKFIVNFNEIFSGDLKTFIDENKYNNNKNLLINTLEQLFISILTFHKNMNLSHNDCHWGNFLYHKIKPGGYIHYKIFDKDIYIKNYGYLWIIWDYGLTSSLRNPLIDYNRVVNAFISEKDGGWNRHLASVNDYNKLSIFNRGLVISNYIKDNLLTSEKELFDKLFKYHINVYNKPPDNEIINLKNIYVI